MVDLHDAILQIGRHFIATDPKFMKISLEPDFSLDSHAKDHEKFTQGFPTGVKRAKALVGTDFLISPTILIFDLACFHVFLLFSASQISNEEMMMSWDFVKMI